MPQGQAGCPSKALTFAQAEDVLNVPRGPRCTRESAPPCRPVPVPRSRGRSPGIDGINADEWTPQELRHSFVSLLSDRGVPPEVIPRLVGHSGTPVAEEVRRKQFRPVIQTGAMVMDGIFSADPQRP